MKTSTHPGKLVKNEIEELGLSVAEAASALGVTRQQLYNVINGKSAVTVEMSVRLEKGIGSTADTWLRMQAAYDLAQLRNSKAKIVVKRMTRKAA